MPPRKSPSVPLTGKLSPPRLGRVFDRERLFALLDGWADRPAIWIGAAPGAGKSTLAATWLERRNRSTLWLQVDPGDADPATFLKSIDVLLSSAVPKRLALPAFHADDMSDLAGWLRRRLRLFLQHLPPSWALVFDNHQELPADSPLQAALAQAIRELPRGVQWLFVSREPPPQAYARAIADQQMAIVDPDLLRFDHAEAVALARLHGRPDDAAPALAAAQGWAGGMTLMLLGSPRESGSPGLGARQRLFDYFAGEVLARMPAADREAVCAIAFLPAATGAMAAALSGNPRAPELLERLAAQSLFTDRRLGREGAPLAYVFHALFSEFLRRHYEQGHSAEQLKAVRVRAARLLADAGQTDAALERMLDAGSWPDAQRMLLDTAARYVADGRTLALRQHIDALPEPYREPLLYWRGYCDLDTDPAGALSHLVRAHAASAAAGDADGELAAAAAIATALVATRRINELDPWLAVLDRHAARAAVRQPEGVEMRWVPGLLAAVVHRRPWHPLADVLAERAERLLHREDAPGQRLLPGALAFHLLWRGHVDRLERIVLRIDALCAQQLAAPVTMMRWWGVGILVKALLGQHDSVRRDAELALALVASEPSVAAQRASVELLHMFAAIANQDAATARRAMHNAALALHPDDAVNRAMYEHQHGMLALLEDDGPGALRLMRASVASAQQGGFSMREHIALIANALAAARVGAHDEASRLLDAVFAHPFHAICRWHHWIAGIVAAYAALRRGDAPQGLVHLREALRTARDCGYRHGPMLYCCPDMMAELAALALAHGIEPDVARDIVIRNRLPAPPLADESWPWPVRIHALGALRIERADGPLPVSRKQSRRLLEMLRLLVAHGDTPVAVDAIADELWPDAEGDAARNALVNALHRLRKLLGGDDCILLRQGTLSLNPQRCWTDVQALGRLLGRIDGDPAASLPALLASVHRLCRAPLLPDDPLPGVVACRAALQQRLSRTLRGAAQRMAAAGMTTEAAAVNESLSNL